MTDAHDRRSDFGVVGPFNNWPGEVEDPADPVAMERLAGLRAAMGG